MNILKCKLFKKLEEPINCGTYTILGIFPYEAATVVSSVTMPRCVSNEIFNNLPEYLKDNKIVIICQNNVNFGTSDFAVNVKDCGCRFGSWADVKGYAGRELE